MKGEFLNVSELLCGRYQLHHGSSSGWGLLDEAYKESNSKTLNVLLYSVRPRIEFVFSFMVNSLVGGLV